MGIESSQAPLSAHSEFESNTQTTCLSTPSLGGKSALNEGNEEVEDEGGKMRTSGWAVEQAQSYLNNQGVSDVFEP